METRTPARRWLRPAAVLLAVLVWAPTSGAGADDLDAARTRHEDVRRQQAALAAELDVLGADKAQVDAVLDTLEANVAAEQDRFEVATEAAERSRGEAARAQAEEDRIEADVVEQRTHVRDLAVDAFIAGGAELADLALLLRSADARDAAKVRYLSGAELERQGRLGEDLTEVATQLERARRTAEQARSRAAAEEEAVAARLADAEAAAQLQAGFVAEVEAELERRLAEAAALAELDRDLAAEILAGELALAARLAADAQAAGVTVASSGAGPATARDVRVVAVRGINVNVAIAGNLEALLAAAAADGIALGGGGYRDAAAQIATRRANCGPTDHDLHVKPASQCTPPTARPGHSMHERGLAIDFERDGALITSRSDPGFVWLAANAARFGLQNLPSEPWHWSVNGN